MPPAVINRLFRRFRQFSFRETHRQLGGQPLALHSWHLPHQYPRPLSMRSSWSPSGLWPMSARKFSRISHRSQTVIPRPPYHLKVRVFGFLHRATIECQMAYILTCPRLRARHAAMYSGVECPLPIISPFFRFVFATTNVLGEIASHSHAKVVRYSGATDVCPRFTSLKTLSVTNRLK